MSVDPTTMQTVEIEVRIKPILRVNTLGGRGKPSRASVLLGRVAVAMHDQDAFDQDNLPEVYLAGEAIVINRWRRKAHSQVVELAEYPGSIAVRTTLHLAGISLTTDDLARVEFSCFVRLEDPIRLLSREPKWDVPEGQMHLQDELERLVRHQLEAALTGKPGLWSDPDVRQVVQDMLAGLDDSLRRWGLRVESPSSIKRTFPANLSTVVLQFSAAESSLIASLPEQGRTLVDRLGLSARVTDIRVTSGEMGRGAGLYKVLRDMKQLPPEIENWLKAEQKALAVVDFCSKMGSSNATKTEYALTDKVIGFAFRFPILGLGEWGSVEMDDDFYRYRQLEAFLEMPVR